VAAEGRHGLRRAGGAGTVATGAPSTGSSDFVSLSPGRSALPLTVAAFDRAGSSALVDEEDEEAVAAVRAAAVRTRWARMPRMPGTARAVPRT
jgi:hypothetical protein